MASMGLCLSSQALGLALGTMPAESREEAPTHPRPAREDGGWEEKGGTISKLLLPQKDVQIQSPV